MTAGYSGTPLAKKLGLKPGQSAWLVRMPASVRADIGDVGLCEVDAIESGPKLVVRKELRSGSLD